jgi:hypothetical protein
VNLVPVVSSNLAAVGYDPAVGEMHIEFRSGRIYSYRVPYSVYEALMSAGSKGRYFSYYIRWRYRGRRIR